MNGAGQYHSRINTGAEFLCLKRGAFSRHSRLCSGTPMRLPLLPPLLLAAALTAHAASDPSKTPLPQNALGHADEHGCLSVWRDFGNGNCDCSVSRSRCAFNFAARGLPRGSSLTRTPPFLPGRDFSFPYLGCGWLCPLLESSISMREYHPEVYVLLPTGKKLTLAPDHGAGKDSPDAAVLHSADGRWRGEWHGNTFVLSSDADGWELTFLGNRIKQWKNRRQCHRMDLQGQSCLGNPPARNHWQSGRSL